MKDRARRIINVWRGGKPDDADRFEAVLRRTWAVVCGVTSARVRRVGDSFFFSLDTCPSNDAVVFGEGHYVRTKGGPLEVTAKDPDELRRKLENHYGIPLPSGVDPSAA